MFNFQDDVKKKIREYSGNKRFSSQKFVRVNNTRFNVRVTFELVYGMSHGGRWMYAFPSKRVMFVVFANGEIEFAEIERFEALIKRREG